MLARRHFLYKRSHNIGGHPGLAARAKSTPVSQGSSAENTPSPSPSTSSVADTTPSLTSPTPVASVEETTSTPATSTSSSPSPSSTPAASSPSSPASSSSTAKSSALTSSSPTSTAPSLVSNSLTPVSTPITYATSVGTRAITSILSTPTSSLAPSTTASAGSSGGTNTGAIVGGIAGTLAGIAVLGFLLMWCMRRQRNRDIDDFDAKAFKRQSAILVDDPVEPPRSYNPRPPTMIERHNASPALAAQAGHGDQNIYGGYGGYGQQHPYAPEMIQPAGSSSPQGYGAMGYASYNDPQQQHPSMVYSGYDSQQQLARQPSNATFLTRQPSTPGYAHPIPPPGSLDPNAHYLDLNRSSVSPYQAAQYADISRQLGTTDPNGHVVPELSELPEEPLPSPFDDPVQATQVPGATSHLTHSSNVAAPVPPQGNATQAHQRPATFYNEDDAYAGI